MHDIRQLEQEQERKYEETRYVRRARVLSAIMIPTWFPEYDPAVHELDHRFSVRSGYENHVPLEIISGRSNLQLLTPEENKRKGKKCSISIEELVEGYRFNPFVTEVAAKLKRMPLWDLKKAMVRISRKLRELREAKQLTDASAGVSGQTLPPLT